LSNNQTLSPEEIQQQFHAELDKMLNPTTTHIDVRHLDKKRYRKVRWFFAKIFLHVIWWDIILNRPILSWFRTEPLPRWRNIAAKFRELALEMGGVLIKLGQFLSTRVDILPPEVTGELAGLQDAVPPVPFPAVKTQIEADFGRPLATIFAEFKIEPLGAASLSQAHRATLKSGEDVVVKVLRPGIKVLVETDLAAIALALKWLKFYKTVSKRVDLDRLSEEFTTVTRYELDFENEGKNAERFAEDFANDPQVYIPKVYWDYAAPHTLTLEDVSYIKIGELTKLDEVGISRPQVAKKFYQLYMEQCFVTNFVHSDPHPGNVFVRPLRHPDEPENTVFLPGDPVPYQSNRPFQLVFVDFGMMAVVPERLRAALREYAIGIGTRDAYRVVKSYQDAGTLLPGADIKRLEEAHEEVFTRFWGVKMGDLNEVSLKEAQYFISEYRDLIQEAPFQFQADMLFVVRAIGILSGMATQLDPEFDPWAETIPFAEKLAQEEIQRDWQGWVGEAINWGQLLFKIPNKVERVLTLAQRGNLTVEMALAPDSRKMATRIERSITRLMYSVLAVGLLIASIIGQEVVWYADGLVIIAIIFLIWGLFKVR